MKLISSSYSFPLPFYNIFSQKNFPWFSHHIEIWARKYGRGSVRELGPRKVTVKTGQKHKNKMAISMVVFVFLYVFLMRILYKTFRLLAEWLPGVWMGEEQNQQHLRGTIMQLKSEQLRISAQDEFARYMRLQRQINKLSEELSQLVKQRGGKVSRRRKILTAIFMGILAVCHMAFLFTYRKDPVVVLPAEWFHPLNSILAFPTGITGAIGLPCWIVTSNKIISTVLI
ncbi:tail-anchored protein insertion receptor WRB-like isoform X2 [Orbicella faveolata]|uniref:tail-anchored protein insertion receptor WRB-like isoform X2 n=1 Tax=Orbicella faveolata TaxID=48498 RepID=UPI0009E3D526|nr:tail-anchored protein insertion receptor WRB-like isoform X2 [Orbicella faveolata]